MIFQLLPATRWLPPTSPYCTWLQKNIPLIPPGNDLTRVQSIVGHFPRIALCLHKTVNLTFNCSKIAHLSWHEKISKRNIFMQYNLKADQTYKTIKDRAKGRCICQCSCLNTLIYSRIIVSHHITLHTRETSILQVPFLYSQRYQMPKIFF